MINWNAVQIEFRTTADLTAQANANAIADEPTRFGDAAVDGGHPPALAGELFFNLLKAQFLES